jgi:hypothetical protein
MECPLQNQQITIISDMHEDPRCAENSFAGWENFVLCLACECWLNPAAKELYSTD